MNAEARQFILGQVDPATTRVLADIANDVGELERDAEVTRVAFGRGRLVAEDARGEQAHDAGDAMAVSFEVGEVRAGSIKLEETVLPCGITAGLEPVLVLINDQEFTKTANCWGVDNMSKGTNTNRIVLFRKPA